MPFGERMTSILDLSPFSSGQQKQVRNSRLSLFRRDRNWRLSLFDLCLTCLLNLSNRSLFNRKVENEQMVDVTVDPRSNMPVEAVIGESAAGRGLAAPPSDS
jgi:hypothetical protein